MATFPSYVKLGWRDTAEQHTPVIARSEMERGIARHRRIAADSLVTVPVTAYFDTAAESLAFESWFFSDAAAGAAWFDFTLPRTGALVQARLVGGDIGQLKPATKNWAFSERSFQLEYIRPNFIQLPPGLHSVDSGRILSVQRASAATYIDAAGVLQTAPANVARYQGGQLLVEDAATNLLRYSGDFSNAAWIKNNVAAVVSAGVGPNGVAGASYRVYSGSLGNDFIQQAPVAPVGTPLVASFFVKNDDALASHIMVRSSLTTATFFLTWSGASIASMTGGSCGWLPMANGWNRVWCAYTSGEVNQYVRVYPDTANAGRAVYLWGGDAKVGADLSSHVQTTTAPVTRAADIITVAA